MAPFDYFVVFAEMRTGSNFLEDNLNQIEGLTCHGEAYNPTFIGVRDSSNILGVTFEDREADPFSLLEKIKTADGMNGFRYFNDHDPRVFDALMDDPRCAKIILTRNPAESYVSLKIAVGTDQWRMTDVRRHREAKATFRPEEFDAFVSTVQAFQLRLLNKLQTTGQTAFYIGYEDLNDADVMNGMASFLGASGRLSALSTKLKKQNPSSLSEKVANFEEMEVALADHDRFNLSRTPNFEPRRGPAVPSYLLPPHTSLMFLPIGSGPTAAVANWLAGLDDVAPDELLSQVPQSALRKWKRDRTGHRSFTVVRHPVARAHTAFVDQILNAPEQGLNLRDTLRRNYKIPMPAQYPSPEYSLENHRTAFKAFLEFLKANLSGQTGVRVSPFWATQLHVIQGFSEFSIPDVVMRESTLEEDLAVLAAQVGKSTMPALADATDPHAELLRSIYDDDIEKRARAAYLKDYDAFGFGPYTA